MDEQLSLTLIAEMVIQLRRDLDAVMERLDEIGQGADSPPSGTFDDD
jgi:hypothetical protein